ncbi:MAG: hypothetical protein BWY71_00939 [Planctomycetes bacterium ADurb.Bin412]|nr:MAG: hypothetical protein BWY71_00939 [Planctomycetes bacterium ADurb.Bin412]
MGGHTVAGIEGGGNTALGMIGIAVTAVGLDQDQDLSCLAGADGGAESGNPGPNNQTVSI